MLAGRFPMIVLVFTSASVSEIMSAMNEVAEPYRLLDLDEPEWFFPEVASWRVLARFDPTVLESYTETERESVRAEVGPAPSAVLTMTLNGRAIGEACDAGKMLARHLLGIFDGIADDRSGGDSIWTEKQIRETNGKVAFLNCYRED